MSTACHASFASPTVTLSPWRGTFDGVRSATDWALTAAWTAVSVSCPLVRIGSRMSHRCRNPSALTAFVADAGRASDGAGPRARRGALRRGGARRYRSASRAGDNQRGRATTVDSWRLERPTVSIAVGVEPGECRHAAADGRERPVVPAYPESALGITRYVPSESWSMPPQLLRPPGEGRQDDKLAHRLSPSSARSVPAMVILKYGEPG